MPCYQPREIHKTIYESGISPKQFNKLEEENDWLKGAICALMNELSGRGILASVIAESSRNGLIDLIEFWDNHEKSDQSRIAKILHLYSKDDQAIMKRLLND